jgi:Spy/CpxP family protein refolding chaperone
MSNETSTSNKTQVTDDDNTGKTRARRRSRWVVGALLGALAIGTGTAVLSRGGMGFDGPCSWDGRAGFHGGPFGHRAPVSAELRQERMTNFVRHVLVDLDATAEQQNRILEIVQRTVTDAAPLWEKRAGGRRQAVELLSAPQIDRAAVEKLRQEQVVAIETASKRMTDTLLDVAEVLTPEQRARLADRIAHFPFGRG